MFTLFANFGRLWEASGVLWGLILGVKIEKNGVWVSTWPPDGFQDLFCQKVSPILEAFWVPKNFPWEGVSISGGPKISRRPKKPRIFSRRFQVLPQLVDGTAFSSMFRCNIDETSMKTVVVFLPCLATLPIFFGTWRPLQNTVIYDTLSTFCFFCFCIFFGKMLSKIDRNR